MLEHTQCLYDFCRCFGHLITRGDFTRRFIRIEWDKCDVVFLMQDVKIQF